MPTKTDAISNLSGWPGHPTPARDITPLPPWHPDRKWLRIDEVPQLLMRLYHLRVSRQTVSWWIHRGVNSAGGGRIKLPHSKWGRRTFVRRVDLSAFLEAW